MNNADALPLHVGMQLGPYEITGKLDSGGMGVVFRGHDKRLHRDVAIKVLRAEVGASPERIRRFSQEARATGALNHPNVVAIYDIGDFEGSPYIVSELLSGETLERRLRRRPSSRPHRYRVRRANSRRPDRRARKRNYPPRSETREHIPDQRRRRQNSRFRIGQVAAFRHPAPHERLHQHPRIRDAARTNRRHAKLHVAGAGARRRNRSPLRHLQLWRSPL